MAMYGLFTFDTAWNRGQFYLPVGRLPADLGPQHPGQDHALRQRHLADDRVVRRCRCSWRWRSDSVPTSWCSGRCATPRRSARWSPRWAWRCTSRASPSSTSATRSRNPQSVVPDEGIEQLPRARQGLPAQHPLRGRLRRADGSDRVGRLPVHPVRPRHPRRRRQREGCGAARLLAADARRHQLGDRLGAGDARRDRRRPDRRHDHPRRSDRADRARPRRRADRRSAIDPHRAWPAVSRSARCRRCSTSARPTGSTAISTGCRPASATSCRSSSSSLVLYVRGKSLPIRGAVEEKRLPLSPRTRSGCCEHAVVWVTVLTLLAFVFENSGGADPLRQLDPDRLVISIVMLSIVLLTGYTGQISLAQMSFAGIAAFITARMMADGIGRRHRTSFPVERPGLPLADRRRARHRGRGDRRVGRRLACRADPRRPAGRGHHRRRGRPAGLYFENERDHATPRRRARLREGPDVLRRSTWRRAAPGHQNETGVRDLRRHRAGALRDRGGQHAQSRVRPAVPRRAGQRAGRGGGGDQRRHAPSCSPSASAPAIAGIGGVMLGFKQVEVSSANFNYGASLSVLAFAYLAGISSINGAIVGGHAAAAGCADSPRNYFFAGTNIDSYVGLAQRRSASSSPPSSTRKAWRRSSGRRATSRQLARRSDPGAETCGRSTRPKQVLVKSASHRGRGTPSGSTTPSSSSRSNGGCHHAALLFLVVLAFARRSDRSHRPSARRARGPVPSPVRAHGARRLRARLDHLAVAVDTYSLWMPILGAFLALMVRSIFLQIRGARATHDGAASDRTAPSPPLPTPAEVN